MARRRTPHPPVRLSPRDRAFLEDHIQFGYMNHVVATEGLRRAYAEPDMTATALRRQVDRLPEAEAAMEAARLNDGARVQTIIVARLVSEYAAAIEDLAGMVFAASAREQGVMRSFLTSDPSQTGTVLADIDRGAKPVDVFRLPDLSTDAAQMPPELREAIEKSLLSFETSLKQVAAAARGAPAAEATRLADLRTIGADRMFLVLEVGESARTPPHGALFHAHNRIKHRFMAVEHLERLPDDPAEPIRFAHAPRDPSVVRALVSNITQVSLATAEVAALLLAWDEATAEQNE